MNEKGSILLITLMVLMLGSLIAVSSVNISTQETRIAGNERAAVTAFFEADAGVAPGNTVLLDTIANRSVSAYPTLAQRQVTVPSGIISLGWHADTLVSGQDQLLDEVIGAVASANGRGFSFQTPLNAARGDLTSVRIKRNISTTKGTGGSTEFGSGYEGIGYGSTGGVFLYYFVRSSAVNQDSSGSSVETEYRKVLRIGEASRP